MKQHPYRGFLIAIEGIDGAGKTTQAHFVQCALQARKLAVIRTKEPTGGKWGQTLRDSALTGRLSLEEEVEYFIKDRQEHVETVIKPTLEAGHVVIVDRYYFSSVAYQGARGSDPEDLRIRNEAFAPEPDLLILLDIEPRCGLRRIRMRGDRANHFERTHGLRKARELFLAIQKPYLLTLDATKPEQELTDTIVRAFSARFAERIAASELTAKEKLNETLRVFGGDPV